MPQARTLSVGWDVHSTGRATWGPAPRRWLSEIVCPTPAQPIVFPAHVREEVQPRCGVTLDGVKRLQDTLVPRARQAPDGGQSGGSQPTHTSRSNRRM